MSSMTVTSFLVLGTYVHNIVKFLFPTEIVVVLEKCSLWHTVNVVLGAQVQRTLERKSTISLYTGLTGSRCEVEGKI